MQCVAQQYGRFEQLIKPMDSYKRHIRQDAAA